MIYFTKTAPDVIGSFLEVVERLFERVTEFPFKTRSRPSDFSVGFSNPTNNARQSLRA